MHLFAREDVLPKDSLCYQKFMVLNELNNLKIDGRKVPVEVKQESIMNYLKRKRKCGERILKNIL